MPWARCTRCTLIVIIQQVIPQNSSGTSLKNLHTSRLFHQKTGLQIFKVFLYHVLKCVYLYLFRFISTNLKIFQFKSLCIYIPIYLYHMQLYLYIIYHPYFPQFLGYLSPIFASPLPNHAAAMHAISQCTGAPRTWTVF